MFTRERKQGRITAAAIIIGLAALAAYSRTFPVPFFFDDTTAITENPTIQRLESLGEVLSPPNDGSGVTGRPLVNLTLAINYAFGGVSVTGYHIFNVLLHIASALTLLGLVRRTLSQPVLQADLGQAALPLAFAIALGWAVHPLQTESVTCVIQRTELLVGLFYLLTLYCVVRSVAPGASRGWAGAAIGACWCGMASKEVMVSAPLVVLFYDRTFIAGTFREAWRRRRNLYLGLAMSWILLAVVVARAGGSRGTAAGFGLGITWWSYALKQCEAILHYLWLAMWPHPLVLDYGTGVVTDVLEVAPQALVLVLLVAGTIFALGQQPSGQSWSKRALGFAGLCFFAILAPSSSIVPLVTQTMAEHRMYLPLAAVLAAGIAGVYALVGRRGWWPLGGLFAVLGVLSLQRNETYRTELGIWTDTLAHSPQSVRVHVDLGNALSALGHYDQALAHYETALQLNPAVPQALTNVGSILIKTGRAAEAKPFSEAALRLSPNSAEAHSNLGIALCALKQFDAALREFELALAQKPLLAVAHSNLAGILIRTREFDTAAQHCEVALRQAPDLPDAHYNLGVINLRQARLPEAIAQLKEAVRLRPTYAEAEGALAAALLQSAHTTEAIEHFEIAMKLKLDDAEAQCNFATALFQAGRWDAAIARYREAIRLNPDYPEVHGNLGIVLVRLGKLAEAIPEFEAALRLKPDYPDAQHGLDWAKTHLPTAAPP